MYTLHSKYVHGNWMERMVKPTHSYICTYVAVATSTALTNLKCLAI